MPFALLPALDLTGGRLGAWTPDGPTPIEAHGGDPAAAAASLIARGARWLHVVDMDLAFGGAPAHIDLIATLAEDDVSIQVSGGIRRWTDASAYLEAGAARIVVGSAALADETELRRTIERGGDRIVVGLEVQDRRIRSRGVDPVDLELMATLGWLATSGVPAFLATAVTRVGAGAGPDVDLIRRVVRSGVPTLAAGGIATLEDLRAARRAGAVGAVVGRAALDGRLDLAEALAWAAV
jgi:phosphoribosylformimino-5-aminoimidazole carboxamide ribotide isomerase